VAAISAIVSLFLLYAYVATAEDRVLKSLDSAKVYVAVNTLAAGTSLNDALNSNLIQERSYPAQAVPLNSIQEVTSSNGSLVALSDLAPGEILLQEAFGEKILPKVDVNPGIGKVAVTVELGFGAKLGNFLKPGVEVSIYATIASDEADGRTTQLLFERIQILAIGGQVDSQTPTTDASSNFVTFAVEVSEAEKLIEAAQSASLYLALPGAQTTSSNS
jgi:pilus assembly protein CpaB